MPDLHIARPALLLLHKQEQQVEHILQLPELMINAATGDIDLVASTPGTYTVTYSFTSGTCSNTSNNKYYDQALPTATIAYAEAPYCATGTATVTQTGTAGGTYIRTAGLTINAATGDIDLVASTPGTYTISYTFTSGTCSNTTTTSITINALPTATIDYAGSPYCATGIATVTQTGQAGGTYSSTAGLTINAATGDIDLVASTPGTYTVTYTLLVEPAAIQQQQISRSMHFRQQHHLHWITILRDRHCNCNTNRNSRWNISAPAGLTINAATGDIDLATSTPGTYTVTYTFTMEHAS